MDKIIAIIILIVGIFICSYAPSKYDFSYSILCGVIYCVVIIAYYLIRKKNNYFDFDSLFLFTLFFVTLYYPIFMYETDATRYVFFLFAFDKDVMPFSSALAVLGTCSYIFGSLMFVPKEASMKVSSLEQMRSKKTINTSKFYFIALVLFVLYMLTGGYFELRAVYFGGNYEANPISKYLYLFCPAFLFAGIIVDFHNMKQLSPNRFLLKRVSPIAYITILVIFLSLILAGSRTVPLQILLLIVGLYSLLYKNIKLIKFVSFIVLGFLLMFAIVVGRGYEQDAKMSGADMAMDLIINNRNNFLAVEQVKIEGNTFGVSLLSPLVAPIPFFQNLLLNSGLKEEDLTSQKLFTYLTYGELDKFYGVGTTIIADVYLAFGAIGIIFFLSFLGYFINKNRVNALGNLFALATYGIFISYAVYLARAEYFFFMRYLIWTLVILFFASKKIKFS